MPITPEILLMLSLLGLTIFIFASEIVRIDIGALLILVLLGLSGLIPGLQTIIPDHLIFSGFSSNAVIAIIAVMILGAGMDKTGILNSVAKYISRKGKTEKRLTILTSGTAGTISSFMQNTGAAALFIPVVSRIASRTGMPIRRLLMPMGCCAITGGTLTLVGSSPLILLNDVLPDDMDKFSLFSVTPIGAALLIASIAYFVIFGKYVLPRKDDKKSKHLSAASYFSKVYGLNSHIYEIDVLNNSPLIGKSIEHIERVFGIRIIAAQVGNENRIAPAREVLIEANKSIAIIGASNAITQLQEDEFLVIYDSTRRFADQLSPLTAGMAEVVIPPNSEIIGKTPAELVMRSTYGLTVLSIRRGEQNIFDDIRSTTLQAGDTLVCHTTWNQLARLLKNRDFVVITRNFPHEQQRPHKLKQATACLAIAFGLVLFSNIPLSLSLMTGALGMILTGVMRIDEAYEAISWKTVFLLACLIPLGIAMQTTGTANWLSYHILTNFNNVPEIVLQIAIALTTVFFTLTMTNVGATIIAVPLAVTIAQTSGYSPEMFALLAALSASNAFILPTHQVSALIMGPGNYSVRDFLRAGSGLTVVFITVLIIMLNLLY